MLIETLRALRAHIVESWHPYAVASVAFFALFQRMEHGVRSDLFLFPSWAFTNYLVIPMCAAVAIGGRGWTRVVGIAVTLGVAAPLLVRAHLGGKAIIEAQPLWILVPALVGLAVVLGLVLMRRVDLSAWGFGPGDWRWWGPWTAVILLGIGIVIPVSAWLFPSFVAFYPRYAPARAGSFSALIAFQIAMVIYMVSWETLWRGFLSFGLAQRLGLTAANISQALVFAYAHHNKPEPELIASFFGGLLIGWFCLRGRSFWPGAILHAVQYSLMEVSAFAIRFG